MKPSKIQIPILSLLIKYGRYFNKYTGLHLYVLIIISVVLAFTEGFGITLFFPLLVTLIPGNPGTDAINSKFQMVFNYIGIAFNTTNLLLAIAVIFIIKAAGMILSSIYQYHLASKIAKDATDNMLKKLPTMSYRFYLQKDTGFLTNIIIQETPRISGAFVSFIKLYSFIAPIVVFTVIIFSVNSYLALYVIAVGIAILFSFRIINTKIQHYSIWISGENSNLSHRFIQLIQSFKYLYSTSGFKKIKSKLSETNKSLAKLNFKIGAAASISNALMEPISIVAIIAVMFFQIKVIGQSTAGLLVILILLQRIVTTVFNFQGGWQSFNSYLGSLNIVTAIADEIENNQADFGHLAYKELNESIIFHNVSFGYSDKQIINKANIKINKNQMLGIVGQSGAGKSTLINLITGIIDPGKGEITIDGVDLHKIDKNTFREKIGYVTQESVIFDDTVANNISLWNCNPDDELCIQKVTKAAESSLCMDFIRELPAGLNTMVGDRGIRLSGGQRQRLAIARELFKEPDILIFDEATSSLDSESEAYIIKGIERLKGKVTIILISHRISTIKNCDYVYVLSKGSIIEEGSFTGLQNDDRSEFSRMCRLQNI